MDKSALAAKNLPIIWILGNFRPSIFYYMIIRFEWLKRTNYFTLFFALAEPILM